MASRRLGRSKPCTNTAGGRPKQPVARYRARVAASAVAVNATRLHAAERGLNFAELGVFGAEIVAPLRDAMRLVDGEHRDFARA